MATLTSFGEQVKKYLTDAQLDQLSQIHDNEEYLESDDPLFDDLLNILITDVRPEDWNHNTASVRDDPGEYIDYVMDNMFKGDEPKWWEGGESAQLNHLISIIDEDTLSDLGKKTAEIRKDLQTTKTIVTNKSENPEEVDKTTITINDPTTNTKAVEKISADPRIATTTTITTKEVGGDFDDELGHVLADVDTGSIVPESKLQEAKDPVNWGKDGRGFTPSDEKSLNGQLVWLWHNNTPTTARTAENVLPNPEAGALDAINRGDTPVGPAQDPDPARRGTGEGMNKFGEWVRVGEWIPRVPASGGYYTISEFPYNDFVPSEDDIIEPMNLSHLNRKTGYDPNSNQANAPYAVVQESRNINEDLKPMDLESLINGTISVDKHKSKLGEDKDVIVLAMEVKNNDAANDLMTFIERGYTDVIDADSISSENIDGDYVVFVEFERKDTFKNVLSEMLEGVEKLTGITEWSFNHYKSSKTLTMEELHERLPITPEDYDSFLVKEQNIKDQLQQLRINARVPMK
jgi:hypothetical protein